MLVRAFAATTVGYGKTMDDVGKLLTRHGVREIRSTVGEPGGDWEPGRIIIEFVWGEDEARRGVRIEVGWQEARPKRDGSTKQQAARALFWFLKAKFDSIDYGIEEFDVAFMPHLVTALGATFAEQPHLIDQAMEAPERLNLMPQGNHVLALPEGGR